MDKFGLFIDLGEIVVPDDYEHATCLTELFRKSKGKLKIRNNSVRNDRNFSNPSRILLPGETLRVLVFQQLATGSTTSGERLDFLDTQGVLLTGMQGLVLVFDQKWEELPTGRHYTSLDRGQRLHKDSHSVAQVPDLNSRVDGAFFLDLTNFSTDWYANATMVCLKES